MADQDNTWVSSLGDRIALTVFFIGVALLAAGIVMYFALNLRDGLVGAPKMQRPAPDDAIVIRPNEKKGPRVSRQFCGPVTSHNAYCTKPLRGSRPTSAGDFCIGPEVSLIGLFERHGKFFDCGPGVRTEATPPHKRLRRLLDQHTDSVRKPLHAGVPRQPEEWRKTLSV